MLDKYLPNFLPKFCQVGLRNCLLIPDEGNSVRHQVTMVFRRTPYNVQQTRLLKLLPPVIAIY